jgi:hypothetical protein
LLTSPLDDFSIQVRARDRLTKPRDADGKGIKGINFFGSGDSAALQALQSQWANIAGIRRAIFLPALGTLSPTPRSTQPRDCRTSA